MTDDLHLRRRLEALRNDYVVRSLTARGGEAEITALEEAHLRDEMAILTAELGSDCAHQVRGPVGMPPATESASRLFLRAVRAVVRALRRAGADWFESWLEVEARTQLPHGPRTH